MSKSKLQLLHRDLRSQILDDLNNAGCDPTLSDDIAETVANTACDWLEDIMLARLKSKQSRSKQDRGIDYGY